MLRAEQFQLAAAHSLRLESLLGAAAQEDLGGKRGQKYGGGAKDNKMMLKITHIIRIRLINNRYQ